MDKNNKIIRSILIFYALTAFFCHFISSLDFINEKISSEVFFSISKPSQYVITQDAFLEENKAESNNKEEIASPYEIFSLNYFIRPVLDVELTTIKSFVVNFAFKQLVIHFAPYLQIIPPPYLV